MNLKSFIDKFSTPQLLEVPVAALVFSDDSIRYLMLDPLTHKPVIYREVGLEPGLIQGGQIQNQTKFLLVLQEVRKILPTPFVRFALPDEAAYIFTAQVPVTAGKTAEEAAAFILEENVPLQLAEANFDFTPMALEKKAELPFCRLVATAASSALVESYVSLLRQASLEPLLCVNESQAIARAVVPNMSERDSIIIYLHKSSVGVYAARGQLIQFSSITDVAEKDYHETLLLEITNARKYIEENGGQGEPVDYILCGHHEMCLSTLEKLNETIGLKASIANVWANLFDLNEYVPSLPFEESLKFASTIGLLV